MIAIIDYEISEAECKELIEMGSANMISASTLGTPIENYRVAENTWIHSKTELTTKIKKIISSKSGLPIENQEQIHIVKYNVGGEYKTHHDFFHPNTDYYDTTMKSGGQRVVSCLFYLNDEFEGGETEFPTKKIKVTPKTGRMLMWSNLKIDGSLDFESLHAGLPVISGTKWIAIVWVREKSFV
jgi:prolyl 4-hydroxylase